MEIGDRGVRVASGEGRGERSMVRCGKRTEDEDWETGGWQGESVSPSLCLSLSLCLPVSLSPPLFLLYLGVTEGDGREESSNNPGRIHFRKCSR